MARGQQRTGETDARKQPITSERIYADLKGKATEPLKVLIAATRRPSDAFGTEKRNRCDKRRLDLIRFSDGSMFPTIVAPNRDPEGSACYVVYFEHRPMEIRAVYPEAEYTWNPG